MGYNPLANRPSTSNTPPVPRPKTAQEAIAEMLKKRAAQPTQAPTLASNLTQSQKPSSTVKDLPQLQGLAQSMGVSPSAQVQKAYSAQESTQSPIKEEDLPLPPRPKPNYGGVAMQTGVNAGTNYLGNSLFGSSSAAPTTSAAIPAVSEGLDAGTWGAQTAADYNMILDAGETAANLGGSAVNAPWYGAPVGSDAAALGGSIGSGLEGLGVGAETAGTVGSGLGTAIPVAGGLYGGYQLANNLSDNQKDPLGGAAAGAATGAAAGSFFPGVGTLIGGAVGGLAGLGLGYIGGDKDKDQRRRDKIRDNLIGAGISDNAYMVNGKDIGKDGSEVLENGLHPYDVDFNAEGAGQTVADINPLAAIMAGGDLKGTSDAAGLLFNSIGNDREKLLAAYEKVGGHNGAYSTINQMVESGALDRPTADAYLNGLDQLFGAGAYASGSGEKSSGKKKSKGSSKDKEDKKPATPIAPNLPQEPPPPQSADPVSQDDYVQAIVNVNEANSVNKKKRKNPLSNGFY